MYKSNTHHTNPATNGISTKQIQPLKSGWPEIRPNRPPTFDHRSGLRGTHLGGSFVAFQNATVAVDAPLPTGAVSPTLCC